jgi:hypothetical protein
MMTAVAAIQQALEAVQRQLEIVKLEEPTLTFREQERIARSRCSAEVMQANAAIEMEQARTSGR